MKNEEKKMKKKVIAIDSCGFYGSYGAYRMRRRKNNE